MRVLVVEDERDLAQAVVRGLSRSGFAVDLARDGAEALEKTWVSAYDASVSAERLLEGAWDEHADPFTNTVRVTVSNLRRKLGEPPLIETVTTVGYVIR